MTNDAAMPIEQPSDPLKLVASAMADAVEVVAESAGEASANARRALPATGRFVARFVYSSCYFASYSVVLPTLYLAHAIPGAGSIGTGISDGASAAGATIREMRAKKAARRNALDALLNDEQETVIQEGLECLDRV
jgi:hypothetical protein